MTEQRRKRLVVILGPTATGKSRCGIALARRVGGEIIRANRAAEELFGYAQEEMIGQTCDELVGIPMQGAVESLNVSVASAVCLYEALRQRGG